MTNKLGHSTRRPVLTYTSPRRTCTTCLREWCESMRPPEKKDVGCTLWRDKNGDQG